MDEKRMSVCLSKELCFFFRLASQIVGPSDGSNYIVDFYGARLTHLSITNETYRKTQTQQSP